jgi:hemoglobin
LIKDGYIFYIFAKIFFMSADIRSLSDVRLLVDSFYEKVRGDNVLGKIFNDAIGDHWPEHLEKMYAFWQTVFTG